MSKQEATSDEKRKTVIDWTEVHRRLETAQEAIERGWAPSLEENKKILKARAKAIAREPEEKETAGESIEVVEFLLSYEKYGIESSYVREVYLLKEITPLPCTPPFVLGIINVRGQILSVIDIKKFFELPEKELGDLNKVIILHSGSPAPSGAEGPALSRVEGPALSRVEGMEFGILADIVLGVRNVFLSELQPSLPTLTGIREEYLKGITGDRVVILNAGKLLSDKKITVHEEV